MAHHQIRRCHERLLDAGDGNAAQYFLDLMAEAEDCMARGWKLRRMAWNVYKRALGRPVEPD